MKKFLRKYKCMDNGSKHPIYFIDYIGYYFIIKVQWVTKPVAITIAEMEVSVPPHWFSIACLQLHSSEVGVSAKMFSLFVRRLLWLPNHFITFGIMGRVHKGWRKGFSGSFHCLFWKMIQIKKFPKKFLGNVS